MSVSKARRLVVRKQCREMANKLLRYPRMFAEPVTGVQEPEINYVGFTALTVLTHPGVDAVKLSTKMSGMILPLVWNYLDGACGIAVGLDQLFNVDDYRQTQLQIKGLLNIFSGVQLFLLSYNPVLVAALGISGAPLALAGGSFALATLVDLIAASIDYCQIAKEHDINGWMEERVKEYEFIVEKIQALTLENVLMAEYPDLKNGPQLIQQNNEKILALEHKQQHILDAIRCRYNVCWQKISPENRSRAAQILKLDKDLVPTPTIEDKALDELIQTQLDQSLTDAKSALMTKAASFFAMSLIAVGTFVLFVHCPHEVALTGLALTVVVAAIYLYNQQKALAKSGPGLFSIEPMHDANNDNNNYGI